jgi:hypothetical protein
MVANYEGSATTVKCDKYGFALVNFERLIPLLAQSFAFPMYIEQVFFSKDTRSCALVEIGLNVTTLFATTCDY